MAGSQKFEEAAPLSEAAYAKTFATYVSNTTEYEAMIKLARNVIQENRFDKSPIKFLSIGAGRGYFETRLVQKLGLKLDFVYAVEPTGPHYEPLQNSLESIGARYYIDTSYFTDQFKLNSEVQIDGFDGKFDFILMSHCLYAFEDVNAVIVHASQFLKSNGRMLLLTQGADTISTIFNYVLARSNPDIFSVGKVLSDHSLVPEKIVSGLKEGCPTLKYRIKEEMANFEVDGFIRREGGESVNDAVSFHLQCNFNDLSEDAQEFIYAAVASNSQLIDGKYWLRHPNAGIEIYLDDHV